MTPIASDYDDFACQPGGLGEAASGRTRRASRASNEPSPKRSNCTLELPIGAPLEEAAEGERRARIKCLKGHSKLDGARLSPDLSRQGRANI